MEGVDIRFVKLELEKRRSPSSARLSPLRVFLLWLSRGSHSTSHLLVWAQIIRRVGCLFSLSAVNGLYVGIYPLLSTNLDGAYPNCKAHTPARTHCTASSQEEFSSWRTASIHVLDYIYSYSFSALDLYRN
ncbi:uncharacterized protein LY89DRAFT_242837 [Mollisia scopiformis]|uniref:Uncharacterized protein n=1 Tax=Mollisia scopiformis TaxID=149040 RepID=A0A194WTR8_MOLSC|nr:uncharacterized protein LY89DRAFT_242837 [Mollisia scopiformis]KUJ11346.1 hypothetical protein LY89DRAFT_242837 [Mollisia scopiformis]